MKNEIINALRSKKITIELDSSGFYDNQEEEIYLDLSCLQVAFVVRIECLCDEIDVIEFIECYDSNEKNHDFTNQNIEEIEKIIENNISLEGGTSEDCDEYDPRTNGDTL